MSVQPVPLPGMEPPRYGEHSGRSGEEIAVDELIAEIAAERPLTASEKVTASMCRALARSIAEGNRKGRSVANDAERLMLTMNRLTGESDEPSAGAILTPDERDLLAALSSPPTHARAPEGHVS